MKTRWTQDGSGNWVLADASARELLLIHPRCACGERLPSRERVRAVLDGALNHLNKAKLCDAMLAKLPLSSIRALAMMAHATLRASSMLERCEACLDRELERAAVAVAQRQLKGQ